MRAKTSASIVVLTAAAVVFLSPPGPLLADDETGRDGTGRIAPIGAPAGDAVSLADLTEAARASADTPPEGGGLQDFVTALGDGEGAAILAGASFLWDPAVVPRKAGPGPTPDQGPAAASAPAWSIDRVISWAQSAILFGDWLPSAELGSDSGLAMARRVPQGPEAETPDTETEPAAAKPSATLTDVLEAARPAGGWLADLRSVAALLRAPYTEPAVAARAPEPEPARALASDSVPLPTALPGLRITGVIPQARPERAPERVPALDTVPTLNKVAAVPSVGLRYDGFTRALRQPAAMGLRLPKPAKRPFSAAHLGITVTPGSSADSLAHMLQRVGADAAAMRHATKAVAFNDVVDTAAGVRTVRGLYRIQRKRREQARRSELVDALRDAVPSDGTARNE